MAKVLADLAHASGPDPFGWAEQLAPSVVQERLRAIKQATADLQGVQRKIADGCAFLSSENAKRLGKWGASGDAPMNFAAQHTASSITLKAGSESWQATIGSSPPCSPP